MNRSFLKGGTFGLAVCLAGVLALLACHRTVPRPDADGMVANDEVSREVIQAYVDRGDEAVPELREMLVSGDPAARRRAKSALARITGQWGNDGSGIGWKRTLDEAKGQDKPIMVLQLFGRFDQEFC